MKEPAGAVIRPGDSPPTFHFEGDRAVWAGILEREQQRHFNYAYYALANLNQFFNRLFDATQYLNFRANASATAVASYNGWLNRISYHGNLGAVGGPTAVHETIHAENDFAGIYTWNEEKDEALAWTAQALLGFGAGQLRIFEDAIKSRQITTAAEAQDGWDQVWNARTGLPAVLSFTIAWDAGTKTRPITDADVIDVRTKLGFGFSAESLKPAYEQLLKAHGVSTVLKNPTSIPQSLR